MAPRTFTDLRRATAGSTFSGLASAHDPKSLEQLLAELHRDRRIIPAQHFLAHFWVHGGELSQEIVTTLRFNITAPAQTDRQESGRRPHRNVSLFDHFPI